MEREAEGLRMIAIATTRCSLDGYEGIHRRSVGRTWSSIKIITDRYVNHLTSPQHKQFANHAPLSSRTLSRASTVVSPTPRFASSILAASALPSMTSLSASTWSPTSMSS